MELSRRSCRKTSEFLVSTTLMTRARRALAASGSLDQAESPSYPVGVALGDVASVKIAGGADETVSTMCTGVKFELLVATTEIVGAGGVDVRITLERSTSPLAELLDRLLRCKVELQNYCTPVWDAEERAPRCGRATSAPTTCGSTGTTGLDQRPNGPDARGERRQCFGEASPRQLELMLPPVHNSHVRLPIDVKPSDSSRALQGAG